jgi:hypothetical protein
VAPKRITGFVRQNPSGCAVFDFFPAHLSQSEIFSARAAQIAEKKRTLHQDRPLGKATGAGRRRKCVGRRRTAGHRAAKVVRPGISRLLFGFRRLQQWAKCCQARVGISPPAGAAWSCYLETRKTRLAALLISRQDLACPGACGAAGPGEEDGKNARRKFAGLAPWGAAKGIGPPPLDKPA